MTADDAEKYSFAPVWSADAELLILGSLPGEESLRRQQYYAFRRNAFWPILGALLGFDPALPYPERLERLRHARIALWDVCGAARRRGSLDSRIVEPRPNDIPWLLRRAPGIRRIGCNGTAAWRYLRRSFPALDAGGGPEIVRLPSTSPAAAAIRLEAKREAYRRFIAGGSTPPPADWR